MAGWPDSLAPGTCNGGGQMKAEWPDSLAPGTCNRGVTDV